MMEKITKSNKMRCDLFVLVDILDIKLEICFSDVLFCYTNLYFPYVIFNQLPRFLVWGKHLFAFEVWENVFLILIFESQK